MRRVLFPLEFTLPKTKGQRNEDSVRQSNNGRIGALSDGASISFDSATWSNILVQRFCHNPNFSNEWLLGAIADFSVQHDRETLPWMKQASFDRGSFASLLGVQMLDGGKTFKVTAVGDSLAILCDGDRIKKTFPYDHASEFDQSPQLLSTKLSENRFLAQLNPGDELAKKWTFRGLRRPALLCMTDALGQWVLSQSAERKSPIATLRRIRTPMAFARFVSLERASGRMKVDDTSLLARW